MVRSVIALAAAGLIAAATPAAAQTIDKRTFNVIGTWNFLTNWQKLEQPFWAKDLPGASGGNLKGNIKSITEVNLKGTEVLRLLKQGVFDFAAALPIYVEDGAAVIEASDISGVARNFKMGHDVVKAWLPEMQKVMKERHGAIILGSFPFPEQVFYCRGEIKGIEDLKGKKIRVQGTSQGDFAAAVGASSVTIAFGEVVPALEKGVVDCGITGTMPGYKAKWSEVTDTLFRLPVGYTVGVWVANLSTWNKLSKDTQALIEKQMQGLEERSWKTIEAETEEGVACNTGTGPCSVGPAGKLKLVLPSEADIKARDKALNEVVLARWAKRCGDACAAKWNELVGSKYGLTAKAN
ncbi:MAG: TRAP transporter substrate-binding protein [Alphaproteobacteria bacterium]|nr:TRAP transporter substrate-binding protein [Alphaproteobacteria bacterium]